MMRTAALVLTVAACAGQIDGPGSSSATDAPPGSTIDAPPGTGPVDARPGVGEPANLIGITLHHNEVRQAVVTDTPLPALEWDNDLAATAAAWVAMCQDVEAPSGLVDHNANRSAGHPYPVGENIFASGGTATARQAVATWAAEKAAYDPATGACSGTCGHYTQVVWRTTTKLGCALGECPNLTYASTIVCNYGPSGNSGGKAY